MIPKIIHYCWLSNDPVPAELKGYMATWKKHLPDYEFIKWDFNRFDIDSSIWVKEAFANKKYAFAADYIRMYALFTMGGIYLDMDVEILRPFDDLLHLDYFLCYENSETNVPEVAAFGASKECAWVKKILEHYKEQHFVKSDGTLENTPLPKVAKNILVNNGYHFIDIQSPSYYNTLKNPQIGILPCYYFSPKSYATGDINISKNTYTIHHFSGSWQPWEIRLENKIWRMLRIKKHPLFTWHLHYWSGKVGFKR